MFGFEQLSAVARRFERALQTGAKDVPNLKKCLHVTIQASLEEIRVLKSATPEVCSARRRYSWPREKDLWASRSLRNTRASAHRHRQ
jgi:hypothetical protein